MASSKFYSPLPKKVSRPRRHFTIDQANKALPLVARVVRDIVNTHERATQLQAKLEEAPGAKEAVQFQGELEGVLGRLQDYVDELTTIGCELKDYQMGLIDFVGQHKGRDVYLCWKLGEDKIAYWHEMHAGFAGRQPITLLESAQ